MKTRSKEKLKEGDIVSGRLYDYDEDDKLFKLMNEDENCCTIVPKPKGFDSQIAVINDDEAIIKVSIISRGECEVEQFDSFEELEESLNDEKEKKK